MEVQALYSDVGLTLLALLCATVRIQLALAIIPLFTRQNVPGLMRAAIGVSLSVVLVPGVLASLRAGSPSSPMLALILVKEAFIGLLLGYAVATLFWAIEAVGFFIDNQRGASIASTLDPLTAMTARRWASSSARLSASISWWPADSACS